MKLYILLVILNPHVANYFTSDDEETLEPKVKYA
jgi:hypothetical protein